MADNDYAQGDVLVSTQWVADNLDKTDKIRIVESNEDVLLYSTGHIPNAVHIDWVADLNDSIRRDYQDRLDVSWLFHESAMEGVVLSYSELKAAIDHRIISDVSLIPMYEDVKNHKLSLDFVRDAIASKRPPEIDVEFIRKLYVMLTPEAGPKGAPYRKENPLHRLYYHEIAAPEKIQPKMKKLDEWLDALDQTLIPSAQNAELKALLVKVRPAFVAHREHAKHLQASLGKTGS